MTKHTETAIERLIAIYGSANKTAQALECNRQLVDKWRKDKRIPFKWGAPIERITNGQIKAVEVWEDAGKVYQ
jgi:DNA-binding transcriptional regulator YdaS (Cro superfamily)